VYRRLSSTRFIWRRSVPWASTSNGSAPDNALR
jgi:hypothetical protein